MNAQRILEKAKEVFSQDQCSWTTLFREVFGPKGVVSEECQTVSDFELFERSPEHEEIQDMISSLRGQKPEGTELTRVITIRVPESLHGSLRVEAHRYQTSMNQLAISKLLQGVNPHHVPSDTTTNQSTGRPKVQCPT